MSNLLSAPITSANAMTIFSRINMQANFIGTAINAFLKENLELTRCDSVASVTSDSFQHQLENTGFKTYEIVVSNGAENISTVKTFFFFYYKETDIIFDWILFQLQRA